MSATTPYEVSEGQDGGLDITVHLNRTEADAVNSEELHVLVNSFHSVLWGLAMLRTGTVAAGDEPGQAPVPGDWYHVVQALHDKLLPRLAGVGDAAVRAHAAAGGSVSQLANAMDVAKSTAQYRREVLLASQRSGWEAWAAPTPPPGTVGIAPSEGEG